MTMLKRSRLEAYSIVSQAQGLGWLGRLFSVWLPVFAETRISRRKTIMSEQVTLLPVEAADITILVDNSLDILLPSTAVAQRAPLASDWSERDQLIAEHGYSLLLTV